MRIVLWLCDFQDSELAHEAEHLNRGNITQATARFCDQNIRVPRMNRSL
jgi:hypothetical protein